MHGKVWEGLGFISFAKFRAKGVHESKTVNQSGSSWPALAIRPVFIALGTGVAHDAKHPGRTRWFKKAREHGIWSDMQWLG